MTHYERRYNHADRTVNDAQAVQDSIEYIGRDRWIKSFGLLIQPGAKMEGSYYSDKKKTIQTIRFCCMMSGIRGYPVNAIIRAVWAAHA